ncbi:hypothetical protein PG994_003143 [Apiospora phragmitis]|uniref:Uncharacterized protein n=1 Tax=Apiospora phragmitis TaxID=2905665 RepID=A0ABR1W768_9PEZI
MRTARDERVASRCDQLLCSAVAVAAIVAALHVYSPVSQPSRHKPDHFDLLEDESRHFIWEFPYRRTIRKLIVARLSLSTNFEKRCSDPTMPPRGMLLIRHVASANLLTAVTVAAPPTERRLGLHRLVPAEGTTDTTTLDIIAIHGLDTESPRTWIYEKNGTQVHWLRDSNMLPAAIPEARIYTYDWNAKVFDHAPVQTLLGHADNLLGQVAAERGEGQRSPSPDLRSILLWRPCPRRGEATYVDDDPYHGVLLATVGAIFLATPFAGTDAAQPASWLVTIKGIMGEDACDNLIDDLEKNSYYVYQRLKKFAEIVHADSVKLPVCCFFETKKTEIYRRILPRNLAFPIGGCEGFILVAEPSACIHGYPGEGLAAKHVTMNKFEGPDDAGFKRVSYKLQGFVSGAQKVLERRRHG